MAQEQRFELVTTLGRGGMAEVFLGWMHSVGGLRRKVAIKRILPELIQKQGKLFQQMFVDEARLAFQLEHDNIVRVYDVGQTSNTFFIVMEFVEGFDLKHIMENMRASNTLFPLGVAIYIILQVCSGLGYAHTLTDEEGKPLGLIHNDISPPNILIGRYGEVKVADFGLSDARSNDVETPEGMIKGKFAYISPESTKDPSKVTARSDIFSVGIVLWEMLAGRKLFQRDTDLDTFKAVKAAQIPDIRRIRNDLPDDLVKIMHKALASDPDKRYQTCEDFYHDLANFAIAHAIPVNRYDLKFIVDEMKGNDWGGFAGERVSENVQKDLEAELGGMLPPGEAEMLKEFVTGMSAVDENPAENAAAKKEDWVKDVFDDIGFEDGEIDFTKDVDLTKIEIKAAANPPGKANAPKPPAPPKPAAPAPAASEASKTAKTPVKEASSAIIKTASRDLSGLLPSSTSSQKYVSKLTAAPADGSKISKNATIGFSLVAFVAGLILALITVLMAYGQVF